MTFFDFYGDPFAKYSLNNRLSTLDKAFATMGENDKERITVYYANILYDNYNFTGLQQEIEAVNPDIVALVEYSKEHSVMNSFFKEKFPYVNAASWSKIHAGNVIFSKYPIQNLMGNPA